MHDQLRAGDLGANDGGEELRRRIAEQLVGTGQGSRPGNQAAPSSPSAVRRDAGPCAISWRWRSIATAPHGPLAADLLGLYEIPYSNRDPPLAAPSDRSSDVASPTATKSAGHQRPAMFEHGPAGRVVARDPALV